ncbi:MAG: DUF192 domain-containing protein [Phycisphaerae bacterium]|nr:MAG: DUF192 domain-containing protein [Planctomycetota bacterium]KAB2950213.1 MAG: DUF192 domain-containing protein [Phycisphaerae bacterium]MBE7456182.1 DUF192 domain-containing protein [Planctomycetia bacterium]MCK6465977.1 DUF192 domain-containing protein [Phycisphaerae bacterium]MCL4718513.1 DUF192 domain-containing protein [Phycisphaerae bacterium]
MMRTVRDKGYGVRRGHVILHVVLTLALGLALGAGLSGGCSPQTHQGNDLSRMDKARIRINDATFEVWIARTQEQREKGLMFVTAEQLADTPDGAHRGMLFVFDEQEPRSFWMRNTITALDIAYINSDRRIVRTLTMKPLDESSYPSGRPAKYALEVRSLLLKQLKIGEGDTVVFSDEVLRPQP